MTRTNSFWRGWWIHVLFVIAIAGFVALYFYARWTWPRQWTTVHLSYSPDGTKLLTATKYGGVYIWDLSTEPPQAKLLTLRTRYPLLDDFGSPRMQFVDNQTIVALRTTAPQSDEVGLLYWSINTDSKAKAIPLDCTEAQLLANARGNWLGVVRHGDRGWQVDLWNLATREHTRSIQLEREPLAPGIFSPWPSISDDGERISLLTRAGDGDKFIEIWNTADDVLVHEVSAEPVTTIAFADEKLDIALPIACAIAPDGEKVLVSESGKLTFGRLGSDDTQTWQHGRGFVNPVMFSHDGRQLLALGDKQVVLCDLEQQQIKTPPENAAGVFSPDSQTLAVSDGETVWLWKPKSGEFRKLPTMAQSNFGWFFLSIVGVIFVMGLWALTAFVRWMIWLVSIRPAPHDDVVMARRID